MCGKSSDSEPLIVKCVIYELVTRAKSKRCDASRKKTEINSFECLKCKFC